MNTVSSDLLNIICLNVEQDRHLDRIIPFFKAYNPDVILLQEVFRENLSYLEKATNMQGIFTALNYVLRAKAPPVELGLVILSALPIVKNYQVYYRGDSTHLPYLKRKEPQPEKMARAILGVEVMQGTERYHLINTHFTWSSNGKPSQKQYEDVKILLKLLSTFPEFVLCGDFNAPRGTAIFDTIALKYKDNIPSYVSSTIDKNLHKVKALQLVVDGIFTTPAYQVSSIEIVDGVSDHCAIVAKVKKLF